MKYKEIVKKMMDDCERHSVTYKDFKEYPEGGKFPDGEYIKYIDLDFVEDMLKEALEKQREDIGK